jgi:hypothetical protein
MEKSICLSVVVFTLKDVDPAKNQYIQMLLLWLSQLFAARGLDVGDRLHITMDQITLQYLLHNTIFATLVQRAPFSLQIYQVPQPATLREGMLHKYRWFDYKEDIFMYCDIDILVLRSLHELVSKAEEGFVAHAEGDLSHLNYGAAWKDEPVPEDYPGLSAGKFWCAEKDIVKQVFTSIQQLANEDTNLYYTIEQPLFNRAVWELRNEIPIVCIDLAPPDLVLSPEGYDPEHTILLDLAGEPGNGKLHYEMMFDAFCLLHCGGLA